LSAAPDLGVELHSDILIAEDVIGQGHLTREVDREPLSPYRFHRSVLALTATRHVADATSGSRTAIHVQYEVQDLAGLLRVASLVRGKHGYG
jgi:hypothetical protein